MKKPLDRKKIRYLIYQEIKKIGEDAIVRRADNTLGGSRLHRTNRHNAPMFVDPHEFEDFDYMEDEESSEDEALYEGDCGCGTSKKPYIVPVSDFSNLNDTNITPGEAFGVGYEASEFDHKNHKSNNYMAKPSLYKVSKYAQKLLQMIPDGYELDDWQRTKIAQIADDISEVYHSLDYDSFKGEL